MSGAAKGYAGEAPRLSAAKKRTAITHFQPVDKVERPRETEPRPDHYNSHPSGVECWTIVEHFSFAVGNAVKYCWRAGLKSPDPIADLKKAKHCLEREIARLERARDRGAK